MTKLQFLNAYFTERLMAAVQEIMLVVGDTLKEYQEEADQTKIENEILRRRLREVGIDAEAALKKCSEPGAPPLSVNRAVTEQQELSCTLRQDIQPTVTAVKVELTEQHSVRQEEEELTGPQPTSPGPAFPSPCAKRECEQDSLNKSMPPYGKSDCSLDFLAHPDLKMQIVNTEEMEPLPTVLCRVKKETDGLDYSSSNTPTKSLSLSVYNPSNEDCDNSGSVNEEEGQLQASTAGDSLH
ncbi:hypothetical protein AGOR_G00154570 [Albula goreensis]|uniref:Uncharacterized protein n=1 Tax=Albula goreensis TaxID=1534307 RepID=A0A8T3CYX6_9TELE|nr:hypothetical protein AGOR_G00154570 [Albula goreensis]